jgi:hypothetical protein
VGIKIPSQNQNILVGLTPPRSRSVVVILVVVIVSALSPNEVSENYGWVNDQNFCDKNQENDGSTLKKTETEEEEIKATDKLKSTITYLFQD